MQISSMPIVEEQRLSEPFSLPAGRVIEAQLEIRPTTPAGPSRGPNTLELVAEVKKEPGGDFEPVATTLQASEPGVYRVTIPTADAEPPFGTPGPVCRLRLVHEGRHEMSFRVQVLGL